MTKTENNLAAVILEKEEAGPGRADRKTRNSSQIHVRAQPGLFFSLRILDNISK